MSPKQVHVTGEKVVMANIDRLIKENWKDAKKALLKEGTIILDESVHQTPREFGDLRRSHTQEVVKDTKKEFVIAIGFNTTYAAAVHENLKARHPVGKAKYLEDPLMARVNKISRNVAKRIKAGMRL